MLSPDAAVGLEWMFCALALMFLTARIGVRITLRQYQFWVSDLLLTIGLFCAVATAACDTLTHQVHAMSDYETVSVYLGKIRFIEKLLFDVGLYFPKMSLVMSYEKIVPITKPKMRLTLAFLAVLVGSSALAAFAADTFWCGTNPAVNWSSVSQACTSFTNAHLQKVTWTLNIFAELCLFAYPFPILRSLRFTGHREKVGLALIFALGAITISVSTARFIMMLYFVNDISLYVWTTSELCVSVMVVSLMALRPLLRKVSQVFRSTLSTLGTSKNKHSDLGLSMEEPGFSRFAPDFPRAHGRRGRRRKPPKFRRNKHMQPRSWNSMPEHTSVWSTWTLEVDVESMTVRPSHPLMGNLSLGRGPQCDRSTQTQYEDIRYQGVHRGTQSLAA